MEVTGPQEVGQNGCQSEKVWHILEISKWLTFDGIFQLFSSNEHESGHLATFQKNYPHQDQMGLCQGHLFCLTMEAISERIADPRMTKFTQDIDFGYL
jgi:fatty-acid desaturase